MVQGEDLQPVREVMGFVTSVTLCHTAASQRAGLQAWFSVDIMPRAALWSWLSCLCEEQEVQKPQRVWVSQPLRYLCDFGCQ